MRIAFNATFLDEGYHGIGTYARGLLRSLAAQKTSDDQILVYARSEDEVPKGGDVWWRPSPRFQTASRGPWGNAYRCLWTQSRLPGFLRRDAVDAFLSPLPEGMLRSSVQQIIVVHDLIPLLYPGESPRLYLYFKHVLPGILDRAKLVIADSEHTKQDIIRLFKMRAEKVEVVYGGIEPQFFSSNGDRPLPSPIPRDFFLFVGTFLPRKNVKAVIQAFALIHKEIPHRLVVVAPMDRKFAPDALALAGKLGILDKITFLSNLPSSQLLFLYRRATALLLLSEYEGFGYPPLEAMSVGTPAIVSDGTALAEVAADGAIRVGPNDILPIAESLRRLAVDEDFRNQYGERGRTHARQFDWTTSAGKVQALIRRSMET